MYLKSIEINGFKSFANKIVFKFNDGITAIVGPNGSGKSNVGDAVRWVLGEQSAKQLRGSKMEDIIFAGTQVRKAQSLAYVAITLDNSDHVLPIDYKEVKVARRVFRSGESEYLINGANCRLKDVQELFFDTGIGKEGYSIIGQGQIDKILSGKPDDRRELFDEAAGIVKFKRRKKVAEKDLAEERQNLARIKDILSELENQVEPLKEQAEVAKTYLSLRDKLKNLEINMFLMEYDRIHDTSKSVEEKTKIAKDNLDFKNKEYDNTKEEYARIEKELDDTNTTIENLKNELNENKLTSGSLEGEIKVLNEQLISFEVNNKHYQNRVYDIDDDLKTRDEEIKKVDKEYEKHQEKIADIQARQRKLDEDFGNITQEVQNYSNNLEVTNNDIYKIINQNLEIKTKMERVEALLEQLNTKKVELERRLLEQKTVENDIMSEIEEKTEMLNSIEANINQLNESSKISNQDIKSLQDKINACKNEYQKRHQDNLRQQSRLDSLKNMTERYEGYGNSIKKVMEQKSKVSGIHGVVADIVKVDKKYEVAVEISLGASIQNIVTDNENTAKKLIKFLKVNKFGRATFLPLTTVKPRGQFTYTDALKQKGVIGLCSSLINTDPKYRDLIESLTGRVLVVDNIDNAIKIARKFNNSIRIVTLEGELINPGGSMSGGAYRNSSNLLSRRRELEDIEGSIVSENDKLSQLDDEINNLRSKRDELTNLVSNNKVKLQDLYLKQNTVKLNLDQANKRNEELQKFYKNIASDNGDIQNKENGLKEDYSVLSQRLSDNEHVKTLKEELVNELNEKIKNARNSEMDYNTQKANLSSELAVCNQTLQYIQNNKMRIEKEKQKLEEEKQTIFRNLTSASSNMENKAYEIDDAKKKIQSIAEHIKKLDEAIKNEVLKRDDINKQHKSFFDKREELTKQITALDKEVFRLTSQQEKLTEQLDTFVNYMWEEYEMTYGKATQYKDENLTSFAQVKKESSSTKIQIKALGDVNVNAIDDYKKILERYELLNNQHDDLIESEQALVKIIDDLDVEMRKQFEEKFAYIKNKFDEVFKELFGGGKGTLELIEEEDILDAGIKINAQPPGKKLQNMMQLSGGEKALTAIALLFAIQSLKPSPFCLLDEIEAALDDANVKRYAEYLNKLTKNTQFIVITHRRGTMAAADILYGITMQEKGVSTLVSVSLIEDELDK